MIPPYVRQIERLIALCARHQIVPVFLTQPTLYGAGHHTVAGNEAIARIVSEGIREILRARFPEFATTPAR